MEFNKSEIEKIIPQRDPILLVDHAVVTGEGKVEADVYIDPEWDIFRGHFPGQPVLPGVYIIESMAQTADILLLLPEDMRGKIPVFMSVSRMRFQRPVTPGSHMHLTAQKLGESGGMTDFSVSAQVDGRRAASGQITLIPK